MRWIVFFAVFSALYGGLHLYAFWRATQAGFHGAPFYGGSLVFTVVMVAVPFLVRFLEGYGFHDGARIMALAGFTWMGFIFLFVCAGLLEDCFRLAFMGARVLTGKTNLNWILSRPHAFLTILLVCAAISLYGSFEARAIRTEHVMLKTAKMPPGMTKFRIVQISDVHLGLIVGEGRLARIVEAIKAAEPDLLVSTGDLVDGQMDNQEKLVAMLRNVPVKYGKVAITGNHEFYAGIGRSLDFTRKSGFQMLRGEVSPLLPWMSIAGVDDPAGGSDRVSTNIPEREMLSKIPGDHFALLLKHRPYVDGPSQGLFDLQLSGHTHKGQIFPFTLIIKLMYPIAGGRLQVSQESAMYVSRGTGTWGPPIRFLVPPEVTVIDLVNEKE